MGPGGIATIIAACSLLIIAGAISYAVIRIGRLIDEAKLSLKTVTDEVKPLIDEVTTTVKLVNGPLESFNRMTKNAEEVSSKITEVASSLMSKGGPAVKAAGILLSAAQMSRARKRKKKSE
jgi:methyl-accepting chemotaxis protein